MFNSSPRSGFQLIFNIHLVSTHNNFQNSYKVIISIYYAMHFYSSQSLTFERIVNLELFRVESLNTQHFQDGIVDYLTFSGWNRGILQSETMRGWKKSSHPRQWNLLHRREIIFLNWCQWMLIMVIVQVETLIEQYKKEQGNLPCKLAIACARPLSEAEVICANNHNVATCPICMLVIVLIHS